MDSEEYCSPSSSSSSYSPTPSPKRKVGRKKFRETRHPIYRGVRERGRNGKWVCEVREPNKKSRIWLGTHPTPEMAARAHDVAGIALCGKAALLNFPDSAWALPQAESATADDIRCAAAKAAGMFSPAAVAENSKAMQAFVDEDAVFHMPGLLMDLAEGMMLTPPGIRWRGLIGMWWKRSAIWAWRCGASSVSLLSFLLS